jgi:hypothetical protein
VSWPITAAAAGPGELQLRHFGFLRSFLPKRFFLGEISRTAEWRKMRRRAEL